MIPQTICYSSRHLFTSQALSGWMGQMHIFRFLQKYLIEFKLRLWLGHSRTFTEFIVLLEGEPSDRLRFWMLWTGFSLRLSLYFGALRFSSTLMCPSVPAAEKQPHSMRLLPAHFTIGMILCMWWAVPAFLQTWCLELMFIRPENLVSHSLRCFFFIGANSKCVFMRLHWREDWVSPHCHKVQIDGVLQLCLSFCRFLPSAYMIMELN